MTSYVEIPSGDEEELKEAVANVGPVSVAIYVDRKFRFYRHGTYYNNSTQ